MSRYAEKTTVSVESSRGEIERTLQRYGASAFMYGWDQERAVIQFVAAGRQIKFILALPSREADEIRLPRTPKAQATMWEQACRQRWRALALVIKAKLEAVAAGISEFEDEFLAHVVLPDGTTAGQFLRPQIARAYESGTMPSMLPQLGSGS